MAHSVSGMRNIATIEARKQATKTITLKPTTSPKRSRVTVRIGMAQNGWIRWAVLSPYAYEGTLVLPDTPSCRAAGSRYGASISHFEPPEGTNVVITAE